MSKFNFWGRVVIACLFSLLGLFLSNILPLPAPLTVNQSRALYIILGFLTGLITFAPLTTWIIRTVTQLAKQLVTKLAVEIINQFTHLSSRGLSLLPAIAKEESERGEKQSNFSRVIILDTSGIIDGRISGVAKTGFLSGIILVPNFVLTELQQVADSADDLKRARGRRGFEIISELKKIKGIKVEVWDKDVAGKTVDDKLVCLGKILHGKIFTCDFNLNRVAKVHGVDVLNLNELSNSLKTLPVPGEKFKVKILQEGKDRGQGIGYLPDGAMVVVKDGSTLLGKTAEVEVTKILQGPSGRMIFGKIAP